MEVRVGCNARVHVAFELEGDDNPGARWGLRDDVVAAVVQVSGSSSTARELRSWMLDGLVLYKVPRRIWLVMDLPRMPTGKLQPGELSRSWSEEQR
jgi:acyl-coenzyme A synthetase/AMP-(fatty) acid ligase